MNALVKKQFSNKIIQKLKFIPTGLKPLSRWTSRDADDLVNYERDDWATGKSFAKTERRCGMVTSVVESISKTSKNGSASHFFTSSSLSNNSDNSDSASSLGNFKVNQSSHAVVPATKRYSGVIKCIPEDWQVNELDFVGDPLVLEQRPKGKWKKVKRQEEILLEVNPQEEWTDKAKMYNSRYLNAGAYIRRRGHLPPSGAPVLGFIMYREGHTLPEVYNRIDYTTKREALQDVKFSGVETAVSDISYGQDNYGCITQLGKAVNMTKDLLPHASRHYGLRPLLFWPQMYGPLDGDGTFHMDSTSGNLYRVLLRCCDLHIRDDIEALTTSLVTHGFLNYYPLSVFTGHSLSRHEVAAAACNGDYFNACAMHLHNYAESNTIFFEDYASYVNAQPGTENAFISLFASRVKKLRGPKNFALFVQGLSEVADFSKNSSQLRDIWNNCVTEGQLYAYSAAAFLWNAMASQRAISLPVTGTASSGDLVYITEEEYRKLPQEKKTEPQGWTSANVEGIFRPAGARCFVKVLSSRQEANMFHCSRVVLPVCDSMLCSGKKIATASPLFPLNVATEDLHKEFAQMHGLAWLFHGISNEGAALSNDNTGQDDNNNNKRRLSARYRTLIAMPQDLEIIPIEDPNSYALVKSDLFLLQERKSVWGDLMSHGRIRMPSPYNVSAQFRTEMAPVVDEHSVRKGRRYSTALRCKLPRGSHIDAMLRENFDLYRGKVHDLLIV